MKEAEFDKLLQASWQRPLTPDEAERLHAWLLDHPSARPGWEEDSALTEALSNLPPAPVPTNFTARVMQALPPEPAAAPRRFAWPWLGRSWIPRLAGAALLTTLAWTGLRLHQDRQRQELARDVRLVSDLAYMPHLETLKDFETIRQLSSVPPVQLVDMELLAALE